MFFLSRQATRFGSSDSSAPETFCHVQYAQPHPQRSRQILAAHPEVKKLFGNHPSSAIHIGVIVATQIAAAVAMRHSPIWLILAVSYFIGAFANHAMWVMIHEASHNLIFKRGWANRVISIVANLPIVFASAVSFQKYHLVHHRYQGEMMYDADLPAEWEARLVGNSPVRKSLWLLFFFVIEGICRPLRIRSVKPLCRWVVLNNLVEYGFLASLGVLFGWKADLYLFLSTFFSIGLHPCGARWIQEHFVFKPGQETYSYYGPINRVNYQIGHHNEHHDLPMVAWPHLPKLRKMAPEFYDTLHYHTSYTRLLLDFIFRRDISLYSRVTRPPHRVMSKAAMPEISPMSPMAPEPEPVV